MPEAIDPHCQPIIPTLCDALKQSTKDHHRRAERTGVIRQIVRRQVTREQYSAYLRNLYPVYQALEQELGALRSSRCFELMTDQTLARSRAIEQDMGSLAGPTWRESIGILESAEIYAKRITDGSPSQLAAHAYVRYLGDLNGGQIVRKLLAETLLVDDNALNFYEFPGIEDIPDFRLRFKASLNELTETLDRDIIISEAQCAFQMSTELSIAVMNSDASALEPKTVGSEF